MSLLLFPQDEIAMVSYLCDELGLALLLSDLTELRVTIHKAGKRRDCGLCR